MNLFDLLSKIPFELRLCNLEYRLLFTEINFNQLIMFIRPLLIVRRTIITVYIYNVDIYRDSFCRIF